MPKIKTRKSIAKRFKISPSGKVKRKKSFARHKLTAKDAKRRRSLRVNAYVHKTIVYKMKQMLPYGSK